jgi:hypothetical protein
MVTERLALPPGKEIERAASQTFGLIMIKPNATDQALHPVITSTFEGNVHPIFEQASCDFVPELNKVTLCGSYYRDLGAVPYGDALIDLFYGDKKDRRYFPMISEYYRGKTVFLLLGYEGGQEEFGHFLTSVKGEAETYNECGELVTAARGVRGALTTPYRHYDREASVTLQDKEYVRAFSPVVQNFIHVCDTPGEVAMALRHLLTPHDFEAIEHRGYALSDFMGAYAQ